MPNSEDEAYAELRRIFREGQEDGTIIFDPPNPNIRVKSQNPELDEEILRDLTEEWKRLGLVPRQSKQLGLRRRNRWPEQLSFWQ